MTATTLRDTANAYTPETVLIATNLTGSATANAYAQGSMAMPTVIARCSERTTAGPPGQIKHAPAESTESTAEAVMEIRRRSGLTWEELADLFDVSRRSVHNWANGKAVRAGHDRTIRKMLAAVRRLDRSDRGAARALLLTAHGATGISTLDLLKDGRFDEAMERVESARPPEHRRLPLSGAAQDARRPQAPMLLLGAGQERPDIPSGARAGRPERTTDAAR